MGGYPLMNAVVRDRSRVSMRRASAQNRLPASSSGGIDTRPCGETHLQECGLPIKRRTVARGMCALRRLSGR